MTIIGGLDYVMVTINSSVNFVIYYILGESFRKEVKKITEEMREQFQKWLFIFFYNKDWAVKKVTIPNSTFLMMKSSEIILFFYQHFTLLCVS